MARPFPVSAWRNALDACDRSAELLRSAGFERRYVSMQAESCYYGLPGYEETIRVSAHRKSKPRPGMKDTCVAKITISHMMTMYQGGTQALPDEKLYRMVAEAIGRYVLRVGGLRTLGSASAFQAEETGSIPVGRSTPYPATSAL